MTALDDIMRQNFRSTKKNELTSQEHKDCLDKAFSKLSVEDQENINEYSDNLIVAIKSKYSRSNVQFTRDNALEILSAIGRVK